MQLLCCLKRARVKLGQLSFFFSVGYFLTVDFIKKRLPKKKKNKARKQ